ncbi:reverse transcriptase domain-containing protein, partial [Tanacetum coccineum]
APPYQAPAPQTQGVTKNDFESYVKANDAVMRNMQDQNKNLKNQMTNLTDMLSKFVNANTASTSGPTIPTTTSSPPKVVECETEVTKDMVLPTNNGSTKDVQPPVVQVQPQVPNSEPAVAPVSAPMPNLKTSIPYPSRRNDERRREKANDQIEKFYKIFKDLSFEISLTDALILMPKFASTLKALIGNKEKLSEMARTPLNEHCSAVILNKLPEKLGDPDKFLIPCDFPGIDECLALSDLSASINLMPLSVWKKLSLPELTRTCMTLELADHSITQPIGLAEDVYLKVGKFKFPADFVVVDVDADPRVPLFLGRSFLKTDRVLIDVYEGELTLRVGKEVVTFNLDQTSRYSSNYDDITANRIDVIEMTCEEYSQEVLGFSDVITSGNLTPYYDPIVFLPFYDSLTPFEDSDFLSEEVMTHLLEKNTLFIFSNECIQPFETLNKKLTEAPILIAPDWDLPFELMCDASDFAIGAVLGQRHEKHFRPIHYASKTMNEAESHYTTTEKEMLAVVYAFEKFRSYLILNKSIVYTDHSALKYLFAKKDSKARLLRCPMTWSPDVTLVSVKEKFRNVMKCLKIPSKFTKSLTYRASISWGRSCLHEGTNTYSWPSTICQNGLKRKRSPPTTPELFAKFLNLLSPDSVPRAIISDPEWNPIFAMTSLQRSCLNTELLTVSPSRITHKQVGKLRYPIVA